MCLKFISSYGFRHIESDCMRAFVCTNIERCTLHTWHYTFQQKENEKEHTNQIEQNKTTAQWKLTLSGTVLQPLTIQYKCHKNISLFFPVNIFVRSGFTASFFSRSLFILWLSFLSFACASSLVHCKCYRCFSLCFAFFACLVLILGWLFHFVYISHLVLSFFPSLCSFHSAICQMHLIVAS